MNLLAAEGASVFGIGRTRATIEATASEVLRAKGRAAVFAADLSDETAVAAAFQAAIREFGRVDIVVNAAGVGYSWQEKSPGSMNDVAGTETDKWREVMAINLDSCFFMCRAAIRQFRAQGAGGSIVNVASIS